MRQVIGNCDGHQRQREPARDASDRMSLQPTLRRGHSPAYASIRNEHLA